MMARPFFHWRSRLGRKFGIAVAGMLLASSLHLFGEEPGTILWSTALDNISPFDSCAAIASDGTIYVTTTAHLDALEPNGHRKWAFATTSDNKSSPAIGDDGTIYFGSRDRKFYAVTPQGRQKWSFQTGAWVDSSPAIGADGTLYFGSWDNKFYALNPAGVKLWEFQTGGPIDSSPAIGLDGTIYFGSHDGKFYALEPNGSRRWAFETGGPIISSPAIAADGTLYITSVDGNFYALTPQGAKKWQLHTGGIHASSPALDEKGVIYLGVNNFIAAVNPDGTLWPKWGFGVDDEQHTLHIDSSPAITTDGLMIFGTDYGNLMGFGITRNWPAWSARIYGAIKASPTIAQDGTTYVGSMMKFHAIRGTKALAQSSWPKFRGDLRQTGRVAQPNSQGK